MKSLYFLLHWIYLFYCLQLHALEKAPAPATENPKAFYQEHPLLDPRFPIAWSKLTPEQIIIDSDIALKQAKEAIAAITKIPDNVLTFDNTFMEFDRIRNALGVATGKVINLNKLLQSEDMSKAIQEIQPKLEEFDASLYVNESLFNKLTAFANSSAVKSLNPIEQRFVQFTLRDFKNQGAELTPEKKKRLLEIANRLSSLNLQFIKNATDARNAWELIIEDPKLIEGLPNLVANRLRLEALSRGYGSEEKPNWRLTMDNTNIIPEITYIKDPSIREKVWQGMYTLGTQPPHNNIPLIIEILKLRQEKAHLLGKNNYSDLATENLMMKSGSNALDFVENLHSKLYPLFHEQLQMLGKMPEKSGTSMPNPWDLPYLMNIKDKANYGFESEDYRPYLQFNDALKAMFNMSETLYNIKIVEKPTFVATHGKIAPEDAIEVWHPDVRFYEIYDNKNQHIASFYGDWFCRSSKRSGAWMSPIQPGIFNSNGTHSPHIALINSDATPATASHPSLLSLSELITLFHEFGHLLHEAFGNVPIASLNGTSVANDFVEFPAHFNETFVTEPVILKSFAHHYQTGEPLPQNMLEAAAKIENSFSGIVRMKFLYLDKLDLSLHMASETFTPETLDAFLDKNLKNYMPNYPFKTPHFIGTFYHLFGGDGYASRYYTYDWSNVLAQDVFAHFKQAGLLSPALGMELKNKILSQGNSTDPDILYRNFMGRDPSLEPALRTYGVMP